MPTSYRVRIYPEPSHPTFEAAVAGALQAADSSSSVGPTDSLKGRRVKTTDYGDTFLRLVLDDGSLLRFSLVGSIVAVELTSPSTPAAQTTGVNSLPGVTEIEMIAAYPQRFIWDREAICDRLRRATIHLVGTVGSSAYLDIGNAVALLLSPIFVEVLDRDVLFFQFDVDRP